jgi:hypothetical protein
MTNQRANAKTTADPFGMTTRNANATADPFGMTTRNANAKTKCKCGVVRCGQANAGVSLRSE